MIFSPDGHGFRLTEVGLSVLGIALGISLGEVFLLETSELGSAKVTAISKYT